MDPHDEPSAEASPLISGQTDNDDFLELESGQLGEGRGPRPAPHLGTRFPAFVCDQSLVDGTPSGEVQLRLPRRLESAGEPAPLGRTSLSVLDRDPVGQNKETENLKNQISALQESIEALTSRQIKTHTHHKVHVITCRLTEIMVMRPISRDSAVLACHTLNHIVVLDMMHPLQP